MWFKRELVQISVFLIFFGICVESKAVEKLKVLSFNAALLDASIAEYDRNIPNNREERLDKLIEYLNNRSNADVVCLQEVHFGQNVEKIVNQVRTKFPYSFSGLHLADGTLPPQSAAAWEPSCAPADFYAFITCAIKKECISATTAATVDASGYQCLLYGCYAEFKNLVSSSGEKCLGCLITNTPSNFVSRCANSTSTTLWNMNKIGLLLLSNRNLTDTSAVEFFPGVPNILVKGYLRAKVDDILNMACAHAVPTTFDFPPLNPQFLNFSEQNAAELQMLVDAFSGVDPSCLIGDFNVGPGSESLNPMEESNYKILTNAYNTKLVQNGTFSSENPYNAGGPDEYNWAIDHAFCNGNASIIRAKSVLKQKMELQGTERLPLSNHWGVRAVIKVSQ